MNIKSANRQNVLIHNLPDFDWRCQLQKQIGGGIGLKYSANIPIKHSTFVKTFNYIRINKSMKKGYINDPFNFMLSLFYIKHIKEGPL